MIAASGILVVIAFVTLIAGVFRTGLGLIWTSIAASVLAAIFLALGVVQGNRRRVATAVGPSTATVPPWSDQAAAPAAYGSEAAEAAEETAVVERPSLAAVPEAEEDLSAYEREEAPTPAPAPARAPARATTRRPAAGTGTNVVVIPDRDKFHKETCRYAKNPAAMTMAKSAARRQGYKPCGVCKP